MRSQVASQKQLSLSRSQLEVQKQNEVAVLDMWNPQLSGHLQASEQISKIHQMCKKKLLESERFKWEDQFRNSINIQIIQTNFQSMKVMLHYGNFKLQISVIYTQIDEQILQDESCLRGAFGVVAFTQFEGQKYAIKGVPLEHKDQEIDFESAYLQFFMCSMADVLEVGPQIFPLFGYDIFLTKNKVFFAMEQCKTVKYSELELAESQLLSTLKVMHSIKFIHFDIKPANIAYSKLLQKHVFIDFGLSKIIQQPPAQKTKTKFRGTLSYCSEEMKKCYLLFTSKFVDLYQNDLCCLKKTFKTMYKIKALDEILENNLTFELFTSYNIFCQVILVLRLKYFIKTQNTKELLKILKKISYKSTVYQIFQNSFISQAISQNQQIKKQLKKIKDKIFNQKFKVSEIDSSLYSYFCENKKLISAQKIIPIFHILESPKELLNKYLTKENLLLKLFQFIQPVSRKSLQILQNSCEHKKKLIVKIFQQLDNNLKEPIFFFEKLRSVLIYFYERLRNHKNLKVMLSLRILFISIQQWPYVQLLQDEIITLIDENFLKLLKVAQFLLLWQQHYRDFEYQRKQYWLKFVEQLPISSQKLNQLKIRSFILQVVSKNQHHNHPPSFKLSNLKNLGDLEKECTSSSQKQGIYNIKNIYIDLSRFHPSVFQLQKPKGIVMTIYSRYFTCLKTQPSILEKQEAKIFRPARFQFGRLSNEGSDQKSLILMVQNQIQLYRKRQKLITDLIYKVMDFNAVEKSNLSNLIEKMRQDFEKKVPKSLLNVYGDLISFCYCFQFIRRNSEIIKGKEKIEPLEKIKFLDELEQIFNKLVQTKETKKIISEFKQLQIQILIIRAKFGFQKGNGAIQMKQQIMDIMSLIQPFSSKTFSLVIHFLSLYPYLAQSLNQPGEHYIKSILLKVGQSFLSKTRFYFFQKMRTILADMVRIKNQRGLENQSLEMIFLFEEYFTDKPDEYQTKLCVQIFLFANQAFCQSLNPKMFLKTYKEMRSKNAQFKSGLYEYFIFSIFFSAQSELTQAERLKQVIRTTLCLKNMFWVCQTKIKSQIFKMYRSLIVYKSKRKSFILRKLEIKSASVEKLKHFALETKLKIEKLKTRNKEQVTLKLLEKIKKISDLYSK